MRAIIAATTAITCLPFAADAESKRFFFDAATSSALLDRGEQIGGHTAEFFAGAEAAAGDLLLYATVYRLLPVGPDRAAFDNETDYSVGAIREGQGYVVDVSANWLTYPGEQEASSLELAASISLDLPFAPGMAAFRDTHTDDWGLEVFGGPQWERDAWSWYVLGRVGFVTPGDGSASRSYTGVETGAVRMLTDEVALGFQLRAEAADEDSFADTIGANGVTAWRNTGTSFGVSLSYAR
ncbi:hypothetical protein [Hyphomonas johnsonii]|uniref:Uncharacterized protein n=1 Tax=Hyphomonas johnsonii MHS-2 TaxID=1280950 RepID=A0A059FTU0_9PROT|nr:hypothetical protein [Hyphomonas johnsonii]KCZ94100.1 hypothetical protein HJO_01955 [Hyphomonas johnsonii MHS-2]